jgi:hypothetical protein
LIRTFAVAILLLGISPFSVAELTSASVAPPGISKLDAVSFLSVRARHNVTSIAKNQDYPLKVQLTGNSCDASVCFDI